MKTIVQLWSHQARTWVCWLAVVAASFWTAYLLRFDFAIPQGELANAYRGLLLATIIKGAVFCGVGGKLDRWSRFLGFSDLIPLLQTNLAASVLAGGAIYWFIGTDFPRSIYCLDLLVCILFSGGARFAIRLWYELRTPQRPHGRQRGLIIYGAGVAGLELAREIRRNPNLGYHVIGFIDDDPRKSGAQLLQLPVLGTGDDTDRIVQQYRNRYPHVDEIVVSMPSAGGRQIRAAAERGRRTGVPCRIVPGLGDLISGKLHIAKVREVLITDLLGREPIRLDQEHVRRAIRGRTVLVTGAAGSIGSELCNQLSELLPGELVALDQAESELFRLESELKDKYPGLSLSTEIGDIRDANRMERIIAQHAVHTIFHAAAYKHVPVMERQICEAVRNNVIGTWNLAQAAWRSNVAHFLMISTDKAVNPSSIMGLTKRVAELIVTASRPDVGRCGATKYVCVRFGNVLVSNGSVVPIFRKQIAAGGPVTVTHPDMRRYFMTVDEAVQLVLEASTLGKGSEIFMLDMGKPVRIMELARKMITLAGLVPDEDIEIRIVGVRPGEKLHEELRHDAETLLPTSHDKIRTFVSRQVTFGDLAPWIAELQHLLWRGEPDPVVEQLRMLVPEYKPIPELVAIGKAETGVRPQLAPQAAHVSPA